MTRTHWKRATLAAATLAAAATLGCSPQPKAAVAAINDKVYTVTPDNMTVSAGLLTGQVTDMKVIERVEEGSNRIATPAKLSAKLVLKNTSRDQSVRLVSGNVTYVDVKGQPIALEDNRSEVLLKLSNSYGGDDRLDPGRDATHALEVDFPVEALKAKRLKDIRLGLVYLPMPYKEDTLSFPVSIGEH